MKNNFKFKIKILKNINYNILLLLIYFRNINIYNINEIKFIFYIKKKIFFNII